MASFDRIFFLFLSGVFLLAGQGCVTGRTRPISAVTSPRQGFIDRLGQSQAHAQPPEHTPEREEHVGPAKLVTQSSIQSKRKSGPRTTMSEVALSSFSWPLKSVEITSHFGKRGKDYHDGVDLRAATGTPVFAARDGIVLYADKSITGYGKMIVIRHRSHRKKISTIYGHNSELLVNRGDQVKQGQQIAVSGNTGRSSGPHVHFEIREGLRAVNPLHYLPSLGAVPGAVAAAKAIVPVKTAYASTPLPQQQTQRHGHVKRHIPGKAHRAVKHVENRSHAHSRKARPTKTAVNTHSIRKKNKHKNSVEMAPAARVAQRD